LKTGISRDYFWAKPYTGFDYSTYEKWFTIITGDHLWYFTEPGYAVLNIFLGTFRLAIFCIAVFSIGYKVYYFIKNQTFRFYLF
jgi:hypothetical protein